MSVLSSLLGLDAQHNAGVAQKNSTTQQALQNQYGQVGAGIYGQLDQQGQGQYAAYNGNFLSLLNQFGGLAGLGEPLNARQPNVSAPGQPQGNLAQTLNAQGSQGASGQNPAGPSPYTLDSNQQAQLNQSLGNLAQAQKSAVASFQQQMQSHGITDPRALQVGQEQIQEHFAQQQAETQTQFYEQVKADKLKAMQEIISQLGAYGQQGISQEEAAGSGYLGLASGAQSAANSQQNFALQQQQLSSEQMGGVLQLLGFASGGGFGGGAGAGAGADYIGYNP